MPRPRYLIIGIVVLLVVGGGIWWTVARPFGCGSSDGPRTDVPNLALPAPPGDASVDLDGWKLTLPLASKKGSAASVDPADTSPPWLTRQPNGVLAFWAPVVGARTPNSQHPRTELDSLTNFKAGSSGLRTLTASTAVAQAPADTHDIILGQIHGADDISSVPFVMLHYSAGTIRVVVKHAQSGSASDKYPLVTGVPLGAWFDFSISDNGDGNMTFASTYGSNVKSVTVPIPQPFRDQTVRFQAGNYQQSESCNSEDGALVAFHTLRESTSASS
ncbi:MAG TPA: polysaccharide lyase family 7 protein [Pseudonocardia sp.]|nr:polysaccharide lyase family 7 protein [Pseudonocardia sp.]